MFSTIVFCYIVLVDDGFYMEPDVSVSKVFLFYEDALKYLNKIQDKHNYVFIVKRKIFM